MCNSLLVTVSDKKKTIKIAVLFLLIATLMTACDLYNGMRPYDYPNSVWICETPYIYASIDEDGRITAYIGENESRQYIDLCFDFDSGVDAIRAGETNVSEHLLFSGDCIFHKTSFTIVLKTDNIWSKEYPRLKFTRIK